MSRDKTVILCSGAELNMANMIQIQELLQEVHGFANYHYEANQSMKYLTVEMKFHTDSRDNSVYNPKYIVHTTRGSVTEQVFVQATPPPENSGEIEHVFNSYNQWISECKTKGWKYEIYDGDVEQAIYDMFPECELKEKYRYCEAFLSRWCQYLSGEATTVQKLPSVCKHYLAENFGYDIDLQADMYAVIGTSKQRDIANRFANHVRFEKPMPDASDLETIGCLITGNKDEDKYMICKIHVRGKGLVYHGKIKSQFALSVILDSIGIQYDW